MPAYNKRFCEMAVEVLVRIVVLGITVGRNPNCGWGEPPLRKAAGMLHASGTTVQWTVDSGQRQKT